MKRNKWNWKRFLSRVDIQVTTLIFVFTICTTVLTSGVYWTVTYDIMVLSLEERVYALYSSVESLIDMETFELIETEADMDTELYQESKLMLLELKNASGVMYLYTATVNDDGEFIYVIDGLEDEGDFRVPGDLIEEEIVADMELALSGVEVVPEKIVSTEWGDIFIAYLPLHNDDGEVCGVVGIEFEAGAIYETYQQLLNFVPICIIALSVLASIISMIIFKRISNPFYMDMATKDSPTGLKNRNAYEVDLYNMKARGQLEGKAIVMMDINGLKKVNDRLGHNAGDDYINLVAENIRLVMNDDMIAYRVGGDEFVVLVERASVDKLEGYITECETKIREQKKYSAMRCSISCGYAIYDLILDNDLQDTYYRADKAMYKEKRRQKENREC